MPRRDSLIARTFGPLIGTLWFVFLFWSLIISVLWITGLNEDQVKASISNPGLRDALVVLLKAADALWVTLAAANLYLDLVQREGLARARSWTLGVLAAGGTLAACSVWTGYPLGTIAYTDRLGMKLGQVPFGWPLLFFAAILGGRELCARMFARSSHSQLAVGAGGLALLTDLNLEPLAWKVRLFWFWYEPGTRLPASAPWLNYATWWVSATALAWLLREHNLTAAATTRPWRPALILIIVNAVFLATHVSLTLRQ